MKGAGTLGKVEVDGMGPSPSLCMCYSSQGAFFQRAVILDAGRILRRQHALMMGVSRFSDTRWMKARPPLAGFSETYGIPRAMPWGHGSAFRL